MSYAAGKNALGQCDRCGQRYYLKQLHKEWNGLKTCPSCWEPKQPQLELRVNVVDPEALWEPRPDKDTPAGEGVVKTTKVNAVTDKTLDPIGYAFSVSQMESNVGTVTVVIT